jgi:uncharacterized protein (TIGR02246 family)
MKQMAGVKFEGSSNPEEIKILGDWAFVRSQLKVVMTPDGKPSISRSGYTLSIFKKEKDGKWRIARDANLLSADKN